MSGKQLYAVYDFSIAPASFDFATFCVCANAHRQNNGFETIHFLFVPVQEGAGHWDHKMYSRDHVMWRVNNVITPMAWLLRDTAALTVLGSRQEARAVLAGISPADIFPRGAGVDNPVRHHNTAWAMIDAHAGDDLQSLHASQQARAYARQWIDTHAHGRKCIALTLREAPFLQMRNSDPAVWGDFAHRLVERGYFPAIIRDIDTALGPAHPAFEGIACFPEAAFNLDLRMGLYEECHIAMFVTNGPAMSCFYDPDVRFLCVLSGEWLTHRPWPFLQFGLEFGETPPYFNRYQSFIWEEQNATVMLRELEALSGRIERDRAEGTYEAHLKPDSANRIALTALAKRLIGFHGTDYLTLEPEQFELAAGAIARAPAGAESDDDRFVRTYHHARRIGDAENEFLILRERGETRGYTRDFLVRLGVLSQEAGELMQAEEYLRAAIEPGPEPKHPAHLGVVFSVGAINRQLGRLDKARDYFESLMPLASNNAEFCLQLGHVYEALGDPSRALEFYRNAERRGVISAPLKIARQTLEERLGSASA